MGGAIVTERARAKINLTLHVGKAGGGGLHPLESLVMFADIGDELTVELAEGFSLEIDGPFGDGLDASNDNLVLKAAHDVNLLQGLCLKGAHFKLTKNLPIASGIGGGSADAGAAARAMARLHSDASAVDDYLMLEIGADVPVCFASRTCIMAGAGERLRFIDTAQTFPCVLVNPGVAVSTGEIFNLFDQAFPGVHDPAPHRQSDDLMEIAHAGMNDLQAIACTLKPVISDVIAELESHEGVRLARMSGSGATCFAIFGTASEARIAAAHIKAKHSDWWCVATRLGDGV